MPIITLIVILLVVGVGLYLLQLVPMDATVKRILQVVIILVLVIWVLVNVLGPMMGHARL